MNNHQIVYCLEEITTTNEVGMHFTSIWREEILEELEEKELIEITRPIDVSEALLPKEYWTVAVTNKGKELINNFNNFLICDKY